LELTSWDTTLRFLGDQRVCGARCVECAADLPWEVEAANARALGLVMLRGHPHHHILFQRRGSKPILRRLPPATELAERDEPEDPQIQALLALAAPWLQRIAELLELVRRKLDE
jgi:hypothetical protein